MLPIVKLILYLLLPADAGITDQEIVTETPGGGDHQAVMDVLVTTVNGVRSIRL